MKTLQKIILLASVITLNGCSGYVSLSGNGQLSVEQDLLIKAKNKIIIEKGEYATAYEVKGDKLILSVAKPNKVEKVEIKLPKHLKNVYSVEDVKVTPEEIGQEFGLIGVHSRKTTITGPSYEQEASCVHHSYSTQENCRIVRVQLSDAKLCNSKGECMVPATYEDRIKCDTRTENIYGYQTVQLTPTHNWSQRMLKLVRTDGSTLAILKEKESSSDYNDRKALTPCKL